MSEQIHPPGITLQDLVAWSIALAESDASLVERPLAELVERLVFGQLAIKPRFTASERTAQVISAPKCHLKTIIDCLTCTETIRTEDEGTVYSFVDMLPIFVNKEDKVPVMKDAAFLIMSAWNDHDPFLSERCVKAIIGVDASRAFETIGSRLRVCVPADKFARIKDMFSPRASGRVGSEIVPQLLQNAVFARKSLVAEPESVQLQGRSAVICRLGEWFVSAVFSPLDGRPVPNQPLPVPYSLLKRQVNPLSLVVKGLQQKRKDMPDVAGREALQILRWAIKQNDLRFPGLYQDVKSLLLGDLGSHLEPCEEQVDVLMEAILIDEAILAQIQRDILLLEAEERVIRSGLDPLQQQDPRLSEVTAERKKKTVEYMNLRQVRIRNVRFVLMESMVKLPDVLGMIRKHQDAALKMYGELLTYDDEEPSVSTKEHIADLQFASLFYQIIHKIKTNFDYIREARQCLRKILVLRAERVQAYPAEFAWEFCTIATLSKLLAEADREDWKRAKEDYATIVQKIIPAGAAQRKDLNMDLSAIYRDYAKVLVQTLDYADAAKAMTEAIKAVAVLKKGYVNPETALDLRHLARIYYAASQQLELHVSEMERFEREAADMVEYVILKVESEELHQHPDQQQPQEEGPKRARSHPIQLLALVTTSSRGQASSQRHPQQHAQQTDESEGTHRYDQEETKGEKEESHENDVESHERDSQGLQSEISDDIGTGPSGTASAAGRTLLPPPAINLNQFEWPPDVAYETIMSAFQSEPSTCETWLEQLRLQLKLLEKLRMHNVAQFGAQLRASMQVYKKLAEIDLLKEEIERLMKLYEKGVEAGYLAVTANREDKETMRKAVDLIDLAYHIASLLKQAGDTEKSLEMYRAALQGRLQMLPPDIVALSDIDELATEYTKHHRFDQAILLFASAAELFANLGHDEFVGRCLCNQAMATESKGDMVRAASLYEESLARFEEPRLLDNRLFALRKLFLCYSNMSNWGKALPYGREILTLLNDDECAASEFRVQFCRMLVKAKRLDEAFEECKLLASAVSDDSPHFLPMLEVQIITNIATNEFEEAEMHCRTVIETLMKHQNRDAEMCKFSGETFVPVLLERAKMELATSGRERTDDAARDLCEEVIEICQQMLQFLSRTVPEPAPPADKHFRATIFTYLGKALLLMRQYHDAHDYYQEAFTILSELYNHELSNPVLAGLSVEMDQIRDILEQGPDEDESDMDDEDFDEEEEEDDEYSDEPDDEEEQRSLAANGQEEVEDDDELTEDGQNEEDPSPQSPPPSNGHAKAQPSTGGSAQKRTMSEMLAYMMAKSEDGTNTNSENGQGEDKAT